MVPCPDQNAFMQLIVPSLVKLGLSVDLFQSKDLNGRISSQSFIALLAKCESGVKLTQMRICVCLCECFSVVAVVYCHPRAILIDWI